MLHLMFHKAFSYSMEWTLLHSVTTVTGHTALYVAPHSEPQAQGGTFRAATGSEGQNPEWHSGFCTHNSAD